jgi:hypothetical protein
MGCDIHAVIDYEDSPGYVYAFADGELWLPPRLQPGSAATFLTPNASRFL